MYSDLDILLAVLSFGVSILLFLGKGDLVLGSKNTEEWKKIFDIKKVERGYAIAFLLIGIATVISMQFHSTTSAIIYLITVIVFFGASVIYMYKFCKRKDSTKNDNARYIANNKKRKK